jgi:uncharacterized Zn-finger protein
MNQETKQTACSVKVIEVNAQQLPLSCPTDEMTLWNGHPKVYLPIEKSGQETCPYCGTKFILVDKG